MDVNQPQYLSQRGWGGGRGVLRPEQLLILVTKLEKQWMSIKLILCKWRKLNLLRIQNKGNSIGSVEISITTWAEEPDEATKLEYSASDIKECTAEKVAVDAKGEAAKDFKISSNTGMKKYVRCDKCEKYLSPVPALLNQFTGAARRGLMRRERRSAAKEPIECSKYWNLYFHFIYINWWGYQTAKTSNITTNLKKLKCDQCN